MDGRDKTVIIIISSELTLSIISIARYSDNGNNNNNHTSY